MIWDSVDLRGPVEGGVGALCQFGIGRAIFNWDWNHLEMLFSVQFPENRHNSFQCSPVYTPVFHVHQR